MGRTCLQLHKISKPRRPSRKSIRKAARRKYVEKVAKKINKTIHGEIRISQRFNKFDAKDIINCILNGAVKYNNLSKTYKVYGNNGIYILDHNGKIITAFVENLGSKADKFLVPLNKEQSKILLDKIRFTTN